MDSEMLMNLLAGTPLSVPLLIAIAALIGLSIVKKLVKLALTGGILFVVWMLLPTITSSF